MSATDPRAKLKENIHDEFRALYTFNFAIVVEVDPETRRLVVAHKDDELVEIDNVPMASPYALDGYGELYPIKPNDEGILLMLKDPLDIILEERGDRTDDIIKHRQHWIGDAVFLPEVWFDDDEVPHIETGDLPPDLIAPTGYDNREYLFYHESGTWFRIRSPEDGGGIDLVFTDGHYVTISNGQGILARHIDGHRMHLADDIAIFSYLTGLTDNSGNEVAYQVVLDDGGIVNDGYALFDDSHAYQYTLGGAETGDPVMPVADPLTTQRINPPATRFEGPVDNAFYEQRRLVLERRDEDPELATTDEQVVEYLLAASDVGQNELDDFARAYDDPTIEDARPDFEQVLAAPDVPYYPQGAIWFSLVQDTTMQMTSSGPEPLGGA